MRSYENVKILHFCKFGNKYFFLKEFPAIINLFKSLKPHNQMLKKSVEMQEIFTWEATFRAQQRAGRPGPKIFDPAFFDPERIKTRPFAEPWPYLVNIFFILNLITKFIFKIVKSITKLRGNKSSQKLFKRTKFWSLLWHGLMISKRDF